MIQLRFRQSSSVVDGLECTTVVATYPDNSTRTRYFWCDQAKDQEIIDLYKVRLVNEAQS